MQGKEQEIEEYSNAFDAVLPLNKFKGKTFVIKYGGSIMNNKASQNAFIEDIFYMRQIGINIVIVHGGGPEISKWLNKTGTQSKFVKGLRVTDEKTMEIVEMVLSGKVNKDLASKLSIKGVNAVGLSGRDGNLIKAKKKYLFQDGRVIDIGYVGEIVKVNVKLINNLLINDIVPVISPVGCDNEENKYNINADHVASFISSALNAEKLIILTDVEGVYRNKNDKSSLIPCINIDEINQYINEGIINGGMIPKMESCMEAIKNGTGNVHLIDGRCEHSLIFDIINNSGTKIISKEEDSECQKVI